MQLDTLRVALGDQTYRVERPWGDCRRARSRMSPWTRAGHVFVLLRWDPLADNTSPRVIELAPDGRRVAAWGEGLIADAHMLAPRRMTGFSSSTVTRTRSSSAARRHPRWRARQASLPPRAIQSSNRCGDCSDRGCLRLGRLCRPACTALRRTGSCCSLGASSGTSRVSSSTRTRSGSCVTDVWWWWTGRTIACRFSRPTAAAGGLDRVPKAVRHLGRFRRQPLRHRSRADPHEAVRRWRRLGRCRPVLNGAHGIWGDSEGRLYPGRAESEPHHAAGAGLTRPAGRQRPVSTWGAIRVR